MNDDETSILAVDGGGIRGIIPAMVLAELEHRAGIPISDMFDYIAGTSTGGILALGLAKPDGTRPAYTARDVIGIYDRQGPSIFQDRGWFSWGLTRPKYPISQLQRPLKGTIGTYPLADTRTNVVVPVYDVRNRRPVVFQTSSAKHSSRMNLEAWKVATATSAAPTYFPPFDVEPGPPTSGVGPRSFVDGGIYANNPASIALSCAVDDQTTRYERPDLGDFFVVSIGTGKSERPIDASKADGWGAFGWAKPAIKCAMDGSSDAAAGNVARMLTAGQRVRLQCQLSNASEDMDDASDANLTALKRDAERLITDRMSEIKSIANRLS